jgi:hypothetical protein
MNPSSVHVSERHASTKQPLFLLVFYPVSLSVALCCSVLPCLPISELFSLSDVYPEETHPKNNTNKPMECSQPGAKCDADVFLMMLMPLRMTLGIMYVFVFDLLRCASHINLPNPIKQKQMNETCRKDALLFEYDRWAMPAPFPPFPSLGDCIGTSAQ